MIEFVRASKTGCGMSYRRIFQALSQDRSDKCFNYIERPQDPSHQAGKEIDKNRFLAQLARENTFLEEKLASKEPAGQKAVDYCPDNAFARMLEIIKVRDKAKKVAERLI
ncbi:uncharacterized protein FRV6_15407 [Fusarium oxysporum]|uniref:Uncharacterized protein n=1 Tax=Fusarium oxysporum TaxID=5507 RepID=A0A2H3UBI8_FUSOX|nr:uncharacterized protein FRV6_15407 [Fusarium oxysporum]